MRPGKSFGEYTNPALQQHIECCPEMPSPVSSEDHWVLRGLPWTSLEWGTERAFPGGDLWFLHLLLSIPLVPSPPALPCPWESIIYFLNSVSLWRQKNFLTKYVSKSSWLTLRQEDFQICSAFVLGDSPSSCVILWAGGAVVGEERKGCREQGDADRGWACIPQKTRSEMRLPRGQKNIFNLLKVLIY